LRTTSKPPRRLYSSFFSIEGEGVVKELGEEFSRPDVNNVRFIRKKIRKEY